MKIPFTKMHGIGNDYVYIDTFGDASELHQLSEAELATLVRQMSDRRFGIGGDGVILIHPPTAGVDHAPAVARMQMFNADGSQGEMCGNGLRCVAKYVGDRGLGDVGDADRFAIETAAGTLAIDVARDADGAIESASVDMGPAILDAGKVPTTVPGDADGRVVDREVTFDGRSVRITCVSMGNPHCVIFVDDHIDSQTYDDWVLNVGPKIETDPRFPNRTNIEFVQVMSPTEVRQRTWERGSGETWACGTGASAVCVAGFLVGRTERRITNHLRGGDLELNYRPDGHVVMTGGATEVFRGVIDTDDFREPIARSAV